MAIVHTVTVQFKFSDGDEASDFAKDIRESPTSIEIDDFDFEDAEVIDETTSDE